MSTDTPSSDKLDFYVYGADDDDDAIGSTQDETKRLLAERHANDATTQKLLAVLAKRQTNGRGTQGRKWEGKPGNVYLTVAVPMKEIPILITLLPLQIGVLIVQQLQTQVSSENLAVKWPNDVLVDDRKIAGVLIENWMEPEGNQDCWLLIGIGINVAFAPELPEGVRPAISLKEICDNKLKDSTWRQLGTDLANSFIEWLEMAKAGNKTLVEARVLQDWKSHVNFGQIYKVRETGEEVLTLDVKSDGQLKVRGANGQQRFLMADYLH